MKEEQDKATYFRVDGPNLVELIRSGRGHGVCVSNLQYRRLGAKRSKRAGRPAGPNAYLGFRLAFTFTFGLALRSKT